MVEIAVPEETTPVFIEAKLLNMGGDCRIGIIAPEELDFVVDVFRIAIIGRDTLRCNAAAARKNALVTIQIRFPIVGNPQQDLHQFGVLGPVHKHPVIASPAVRTVVVEEMRLVGNPCGHVQHILEQDFTCFVSRP